MIKNKSQRMREARQSLLRQLERNNDEVIILEKAKKGQRRRRLVYYLVGGLVIFSGCIGGNLIWHEMHQKNRNGMKLLVVGEPLENILVNEHAPLLPGTETKPDVNGDHLSRRAHFILCMLIIVVMWLSVFSPTKFPRLPTEYDNVTTATPLWVERRTEESLNNLSFGSKQFPKTIELTHEASELRQRCKTARDAVSNLTMCVGQNSSQFKQCQNYMNHLVARWCEEENLRLINTHIGEVHAMGCCWGIDDDLD